MRPGAGRILLSHMADLLGQDQQPLSTRVTATNSLVSAPVPLPQEAFPDHTLQIKFYIPKTLRASVCMTALEGWASEPLVTHLRCL